MVEHTLRTVEKTASIKMVTASRGKSARAEPVSALYEIGRIKHVGAFPEMEDQMVAFMPEGYADEGSPDRVDALVWAVGSSRPGGTPSRPNPSTSRTWPTGTPSSRTLR